MKNKPLRVLHVNTFPHGGAFNAAHRIHSALKKHGVMSRFLVMQDKAGLGATDYTTYLAHHSFFRKALSILTRKLEPFVLVLQRSTNSIFHSLNIMPTGVHRYINALDVDVVHLHWISWTLSITDLAYIKKPIVWSLHDSWAFCGAEHHPFVQEQDRRYEKGYFSNNRASSHRGVDFDRMLWHVKKQYWKNKRFFIVGLSKWMTQCAQKSVLFQSMPTRTIHNPIDLEHFSARDRQEARQKFGLPMDKTIVLFGSAYKNPVKGMHFLQEMRKRSFAQREDILWVSFGAEPFSKKESEQEHALGFVHQNDLPMVYATGDICIVPSVIETLHTISIEASACTVPVLAFRVGGMADIVSHKETGYLADPYKVEDLARGIEWVLPRAKDSGKQARKKMQEHFSEKHIAQQYLAVYDAVRGKNEG